jgi:RNA polymerase sigma-70 factor, ECF subfamily
MNTSSKPFVIIGMEATSMGHEWSPSTSADDEVIERARKGDLEAFKRLVFAYDRGLRMFTVRVVGNERTDDVLQETYLKAFRALKRRRGPNASVPGWFYRIVYNTCLDDVRRARRAPEEQLDISVEVVDQGTGPEETAMNRVALSNALAKLAPEYRAAVVLVDALGFQYAEAARILGLRRGTLASRLNHARTSLRRSLREYDTRAPS